MPQIAKDILNHTFNEMMACKSSWRVGFKTKEEVKNYKIALGKAMFLAKIDSFQKLQFGLDHLILDENPYLPSTGLFVAWCKEGYRQHLFRQQAIDNTNRILQNNRLIESGTFEERREVKKSEMAKVMEKLKHKQN
jgi:hypothetical protein